jgi:hypothetical protein
VNHKEMAEERRNQEALTKERQVRCPRNYPKDRCGCGWCIIRWKEAN